MIHKFSVHSRDGDSAPRHLTELIDGLVAWREYYVEFATPPTPGELRSICDIVSDPLIETVDVDVPLDEDSVQVAYKRGIVDNENESIVMACRVVGAEATAAKVATAFRSSDGRLRDVIAAEACNSSIEELHESEPTFETLAPIGAYAPMESVDLGPLGDEALVAVGLANGRSLDLDQMRHVQSIQAATGDAVTTDVLLEALDARWSDHCAHTTWTALGKLLGRMIDAAVATENPNVVSMFHDNAGVWEFYDGHSIAVKAETHNGPSAVSAYFGQLTKIGGVLRDILGTGLGADPIGVFEYTATGAHDEPSPIAGRPAPRQIANETIRAVKEYGNTFGVPMMWSRMTFHTAYRAKPFALGGSIGLLPTASAQRGMPRPGDLVVLIGGLTGNDGIHGASASSAGAVSMDATSVQIGSPLEEIKFRAAIIDLRDGAHVRAVTDLGAAGLNSAVGEMGDPCGVWMNTALVPLKTGGLPMWRILLSESQERMLLAIAPGSWEAARAVLARHEVRSTVVGTFTGDGRYCVVHAPEVSETDIVAAATNPAESRPGGTVAEVGFDVAYELLEWSPPSRQVDAPPATPGPVTTWNKTVGADLPGVVAAVLADLEVADQSYAALQYDSSVQARTHYGPLVGPGLGVETGFYVSRPLRDSRAGAVFATGFNPWLFDIDPVRAARQAVLQAVTAQVVAGVALRDICLCDNFYTPHLEPDSDAWLVAMVDELAALSRVLGTPFISGKDSSAGSTHTDVGRVSVPPAVFVSALGKVPDVAHIRYETFDRPGDAIALIGPRTPGIAGTAAARVLGAGDVGGVDEVDIPSALAFYETMASVSLDSVRSARIVGAGGSVATALRMSMAGGVGADLTGGADLLAEHRCGAMVTVAPESIDSLPPSLGARVIGRVSATAGVRIDGVEVADAGAVLGWRNAFEEALR